MITLSVTHAVNNAIPYIGVAVGLYAIFSKNIVSGKSTNGAFIHLSLALWYILFWADWSGEHIAVWQTVLARLLVLAMVVLQLRVIRRKRCPITAARIKEARQYISNAGMKRKGK